MNITFNCASIPFRSNESEKPRMRTKEEQTEFMTRKCAEALAKRAEREVPENGKYERIYVTFDVPGTNNAALMCIEHDEKNPKDLRRFFIGAHNVNSDRLVSNYLFKGKKNEVINYITDEKNYPLFLECVNDLSKYIDEKYSSR